MEPADEATGAGRTVEEAAHAGAQQLGLRPSEAVVDVLQEPGRGWLGLGGREARVRVRRPTKGQAAERFLRGLAAAAASSIEVAVTAPEMEGAGWVVGIFTEDAGRWIGRGGQTLEALRTVTEVVSSRITGSRERLLLDVAGYRERREEELRDAALRAADRARRLGREVVLDPMPAADRRVVHMAASEVEGVETRSIGEEPTRRVVIAPAKRDPG
jgi:spoIIIJ-associated protein